MKFKNVRVATALTAFGLVIALAGLIAPTALGAPRYELRFVTEPLDAKVDDLITSSRLNDETTSFVQVEVVEVGTDTRATSIKGPVGFTLHTGTGFASGPGKLNVIPQPLVNGVATFGLTTDNKKTLSIGTDNEPQFTDYALVPRTTKGPSITGDPSEGFDVWEDGRACTGDELCEAKLRDGRDHYTLDADGTLGASRLTGVLPGLVCAKQKPVFANTIFSWATTEVDRVTDVPVSLTTTITKAEWRASANNGQAHADWCIGLVHESDWDKSGAAPTQMDTDLDGQLDLWVALAPNCPVSNPSDSAPCIVSQNPDNGGSVTIGYLPGGDPPRKT